EEIGMTNVAFDNLDQYKDIETHNFYKVKTESGVTHEHMMDAIHENSRDNARTPMHWNNQPNAGFSDGTPWIELNPNYPEINVESALADPSSIFYHYKTLIELRKAHPAIVYGSFIPVFEEHDKVFAYVRELDGEMLFVVCNFSNDNLTLDMPEQYQTQTLDCLINNYQTVTELSAKLELAPYESFAVKL
ncbi:alpha-glucosidase C-terminal domain-containing protein, partial [Vibrio sp. 10N.222.46.A1]